VATTNISLSEGAQELVPIAPGSGEQGDPVRNLLFSASKVLAEVLSRCKNNPGDVTKETFCYTSGRRAGGDRL